MSWQSDQAYDQIGRIYHLAINGHHFEQVNNSLNMMEANDLLARFGHQRVSHGWIDHLAHQMDTDMFLTVWRAHLRGEVPPPSEFGLDVR